MPIRILARLGIALILLAGLGSSPATEPGQTCLMFAARNLAKGDGNFYIYCSFSDQKLKIEPGDALEYDVYVYKDNPAE